MASTKKVTGQITDASGTGIVGTVTAQLSRLAYVNNSEAVPRVITVSTDASGNYAFDPAATPASGLYSNTDITPSGTTYTITEVAGGVAYSPFTVAVPSTAGPFVMNQILSPVPTSSGTAVGVANITGLTAGQTIVGTAGSPIGRVLVPGDVTGLVPTLQYKANTALLKGRQGVVVAGVHDSINNYFPGGNGTFRERFTVGPVDAADLRLYFGNWYATAAGDTKNSNSITLKVAIEVGTTTYPVTFPNGQRTITMDPGATVETEPLGLYLAAGATFWVRTYITYTPGNHPSSSMTSVSANGDGYTPGGGDICDNTGATGFTLFDGAGWTMPFAITCTTAGAARQIAILGDSIANGYTDGNGNGINNYLGYIHRALTGFPHLLLAKGGEAASDFVTQGGHLYRALGISGSDYAIEEYAVNDLEGGQALATIQANKITIWQQAVARGLAVYAVTITPLTNSTDGWITTTNQTLKLGNESSRTQLNDWIRDGAPLASVANLTPVATGTVGALRAGTAGHPLKGYFEIADIAETARNSGIWNAPGGVAWTKDGVHPYTTACIAMKAGINTAVFV